MIKFDRRSVLRCNLITPDVNINKALFYIQFIGKNQS